MKMNKYITAAAMVIILAFSTASCQKIKKISIALGISPEIIFTVNGKDIRVINNRNILNNHDRVSFCAMGKP